MKIVNLTKNSTTYTSNVYLVTGIWNALDDKNTLIDVGRDPSILDKIPYLSTGLGKKQVEQVILTHCHYDHTSMLPGIREIYNPVVYAFSNYMDGVDVVLYGGEELLIGDKIFEVIHTPGHSHDSICLYCEDNGMLFAGDAPVIVRSPGGSYEDDFVSALTKLSKKNIKSIYFGHGEPMSENCNRVIREALKNVRNSQG